jgi:spore coat protein U-like protein
MLRIDRTMGTIRVALAAGAVLAALGVAGGAGAQSQTLTGVVGPGFTIRLTDSTGSPVKQLDPGTYTIQVQDLSDQHNFHLTGPGVDQATEVETTGTVTWTVTFSAGTYHFQCDPHHTTMFGNFTVGSAPPPPTPKPPPAKPVQLAGSVGPGKRIALTRAGAKLRVATLRAGPVVVRVSDRSAADNFHLVGPGVNRATTRLGRTTATWRLMLKRGLYAYRSDATPSLKGSLRVR